MLFMVSALIFCYPCNIVNIFSTILLYQLAFHTMLYVHCMIMQNLFNFVFFFLISSEKFEGSGEYVTLKAIVPDSSRSANSTEDCIS